MIFILFNGKTAFRLDSTEVLAQKAVHPERGRAGKKVSGCSRKVQDFSPTKVVTWCAEYVKIR